MPFDWSALLDKLPMALAGRSPGMMQGFTEAMQRIQQQKLQQQQLGLQQHSAQRQDELAQAQIQNLTADNQRSDAQLALQRIGAYRKDAQGLVDQLSSAAPEAVPLNTNPTQAQNALVSERFRAQKDYGVPAGTPQGPLPNMTQVLSSRKKKAAQDLYQQAEKRFAPKDEKGNVTDSSWENSIILKTGPDLFGDIKPADLRTKFSAPAVSATSLSGEALPPTVRPQSTGDANYMLNGRPIVAQRQNGRLIYRGQDVTDRVEPFVPPQKEPNPQPQIFTGPDGQQHAVQFVNGVAREIPMPTGYRKPNATVDNRVVSAQTVKQVGNDIISQLSDPAFAATVGPALGRANTVRDFIGNPPPEFAQLAGEIESYALANMGVHGMRSAQGAEMIKRVLDQHHTAESLIAAIKGLSSFSEHFVENAGGAGPTGSGGARRPIPGVPGGEAELQHGKWIRVK